MRLRYEDFTAEPERTLRRIAGFAGLPAQDSYPFLTADGASRAGLELACGHSVSGNPMRFTTGQVPISRDEQWRAGMSKAQRRAVTVLTLPLLAGYGYHWERDREWAGRRWGWSCQRTTGRVRCVPRWPPCSLRIIRVGSAPWSSMTGPSRTWGWPTATGCGWP